MERDSPTFALVLDPSAGQRPGTVFFRHFLADSEDSKQINLD
jgi:hypothetical protein